MPSVPGDREARPYFFLSYAHTPRFTPGSADPDLWIARVYQDLCWRIMALTDLPDGVAPGFMDRETRSGDDWSERISRALAECQVFVPVYSPRYFASPTCGREWTAFARRTGPGTPERPIVPLLWVPVRDAALPPAARHVRHLDQEYGEEYAAEGLYALVKLSYLRGAYERALSALARSIVRAARHAPPPTGPPVDYRLLPSAFDTSSGARRLRVVVAAPDRSGLPVRRSPDSYGGRGSDWNPYPGESDRPLGDVTAELAAALDYRVTQVPFEAAVKDLVGTGAPIVPTVLLIDRWALRDDRFRELLGQVDREAAPWVSVVIPWNPDDPDNGTPDAPGRAELVAVLPRVMQQGRAALRAAIHGVPTLEAFRALLPMVVQAAAQSYLRHSPARPPARPGGFRPRLRGPVTDVAGTRPAAAMADAADEERPPDDTAPGGVDG
ncbi:TIR-like protein FxsC [Streptomyces sp. JNUCC 64]